MQPQDEARFIHWLLNYVCRSYNNHPKPSGQRLENASRDFLNGIVSALKGKSVAPVYISMELDVWRHITHNKGKASQHKVHVV